MSKPPQSQNLKLLQSLHCQIPFLHLFSPQQLQQLSTLSHFFVFGPGTTLALQNQEIDYLGVVLEGRVTVSGEGEKQGQGYTLGGLGYWGLQAKHVATVSGDTDGVMLAIRLEDVAKMGKGVRNVVNGYVVKLCLEELKGVTAGELQEIEEKKIVHLLPPGVKSLLNQHLQPKEKQSFLKFFPFLRFTHKSQVLSAQDPPTMVLLLHGELIVKSPHDSTPTTRIQAGDFYNSQGFLLGYSTHCNLYSLTEECYVLKIEKTIFENVMETGVVGKVVNFVLRRDINENKYEVMSYEKKREKELAAGRNGKAWTVFQKTNYEIIPLVIPKGLQSANSKGSPMKKATKQENSGFQGTLFRQHLQQSKAVKTTSSNNSKINKIISLKTEKNEQKSASSDQKLKQLQKQLQTLSSRLKFYQQTYIQSRLETIHYRSLHQMQAVFKQIAQLGDRKYRSKGNADTLNTMTLKKAFQHHRRENRINEVVARCAYKWLSIVRRKKGANSKYMVTG